MSHSIKKPSHEPHNAHQYEQPHLNKKIQNALISLKLEGIALTAESVNDLNLFSDGKISKEEVIKRVISRVQPKQN